MPPVPFRDALAFWLKLGFISFGGPAGQISVMHAELVERRRWISEKRFLHALNYCMVLPGPEAQQLATYIGWLLHRTAGGIVAGALFVLPSLLILIALAWAYLVFGDVPAVAGVLYGIKPAVTAIVLHAAWRIGTRALGHPVLVAIAAAAFAAIFLFAVPFPAIVAGAALVGIVGRRWWPDGFAKAGGHGSAAPTAAAAAAQGSDATPGAAAPARAPSVIDDDTPTPPHARFRASRLAVVLAVGLALWGVPMAALTAAFGWDGTLTQMAWFFTKAALVTFGGAYAVLPYVAQAAVERYGWATPAQMIDGLALGETTPGPLIMVVAFVGFVGGWQSVELRAAFGAEPYLSAGVAAAIVVTWFTFLPSFVFILAGGPLVEATHDMHALTAPLRAITAAVVGVIVNLALFFAGHVLWRDGGVDVVATSIAVAAAVALFVFRRGVVATILGCGLLGLALQFAAPSLVSPASVAAAGDGVARLPSTTAKTSAGVVPQAEVTLPTTAAADARLDPVPGMTFDESRHFRIASTASPARTREVAAAIDALHDAWRVVVHVPGTTATTKPLVRLYRDRTEFQAAGRGPAWAEALYRDGVAYAYYPDHGVNRVHWTMHEVAHQLNREIGGWTLPRWANEGLATYLSASRIDDGVLVPGEIDPAAYPVYWLDADGWTGDRAADIAAGRFIPLRAILTGEGAPPLARSVNPHYVHWWSLAHFLFHGDGGAHAAGFRALLRTAGTLEDFERLIGPVDDIERRWYAYLRELAAAAGPRDRDDTGAVEVDL